MDTAIHKKFIVNTKLVHSLRVSLFIMGLLIITITTSRAQRPEWAGVWGIWGGWDISNQTYPWYKGVNIHMRWFDIEPQKDNYTFKGLSDKISTAFNNGLYIGIKIYISPDYAPEWLYSEVGVPKVIDTQGKVHPWYFNEKFKDEFKQLIIKVSEQIDTYPPDIRNKIISVQAAIAKSGDPQPYANNPVDPQYRIDQWWNHIGWRDYNREMYQAYYDAYKDKSPPIFVITKPSANNETWVFENLPGAGRKTYGIGQGYHLGGETHYDHQYQLVKPGSESKLPARSEFDLGPASNTSWYKAATVWNTYFTALWNLTYGVDIWNQVMEMMDNPTPHIPTFEFFTSHAGYKEPSKSAFAWVAFRDDIDGSDLTRFPEAQFGVYNDGKNATRNNSIAQSFAAFGAKQDDPTNVSTDPVAIVRNQKGLNDVQSRVWKGNYGVYLHQIDANTTSQGYWRVGSKDEPYGRFARGFNHAGGKNAIYLNIDDRFFNNSPLNAKYPVNIKVIYFDSGVGQWEIKYDAADNPNKSALSVTNTNTGKWKSATFSLEDGYFGNRGPSGSDISLVNADSNDNIFHMLEVSRSESSTTHVNDQRISEISLECFPNPFNPHSQQLAIMSLNDIDKEAGIVIRNLHGQAIWNLAIESSGIPGEKSVVYWNGRSQSGEIVPPGIYFCQYYSKNYVIGKKILIQ